jgi:MFS superfamily sulfate permease-like transporter
MRRPDLTAGLSVAGLMLPEAVAYAGIAGLPPQRAIFAAIAGCLVYALVGRSRFAIVSATSSSAAILAATLASMPGDANGKAIAATLVVGMVGLLFLAASLCRLGGFTGFISRPVLRGFAFGLAVTIIVKQLPILAGTPVAAPDILRLFARLVATSGSWSPVSLAVGLGALVALLLLRRSSAIPGAFLVLVAGIGGSIVFDLGGRGVALVGLIDTTLTLPTLPHLSFAAWSRLAQYTLPLVLIVFAESWGTIRTLALRHGDQLDADRELGALGFANVASALVQGMPVGAGFSAGSASEAAGTATRATGVVAAIGLTFLIAFARPLIAYLPEPVLAAVVIAALVHSLDPAPLIRLWTLRRDFYVAIGAALAVIMLGVLDGMLVAILLSLAAMMQRQASPYVARLGRLGTSHDYVDMHRHADAIAPAEITIWRPAEPLFFANAERVLAYVAQQSRTPGIILSLEESFDLDSTAADALIEFAGMLRLQGTKLQLARVHDAVRDLLIAAGAIDLGADSSYSVDDAVVALAAISSRSPSHEA